MAPRSGPTRSALAPTTHGTRRAPPEARALALLIHDYEDELYLASPPLLVQRAMFGPLAFIGRLLGYRAEYPYSGAERRESALTVR
jgi:hypothetical protein